MADGSGRCTRSLRKFNNLVLILLVLVLLMLQPSDPARCSRKKLQRSTQQQRVFTILKSPCRRSLSSAFNRFVPKHSNTPIKGGYNASDHDVPSGPNPISN